MPRGRSRRAATEELARSDPPGAESPEIATKRLVPRRERVICQNRDGSDVGGRSVGGQECATTVRCTPCKTTY